MLRDFTRTYRSKFTDLRSKSFYIKLLLAMAIVAVLPNLLTGITAYQQVTRTLERETGERNLEYLRQTMNAMEIIMNQIRMSLSYAYFNKTLTDYELFPNGLYYESLQDGAYGEGDLAALYAYLQSKNGALDSINSIKLTSPFVDSLYYYDPGKELIFVTGQHTSTNFGQYSFESFYDKDWLSSLEQFESESYILNSRSAEQMNGRTKNVLTMIYRIPPRESVLVVNLDAELIYNRVIRKLVSVDTVYVTDRDGEILLHHDPAFVRRDIRSLFGESILLSIESASIGIEVRGTEYLLSSALSPLLNWRFIIASDMREMAKSSAYLKQIIAYSTVLLILCGCLIAYLFSWRLYRPIRQVTALLPDRRDLRQTGDELGFIGSAVRHALSERDELQLKLEESLPYYRERFALELVKIGACSIEEYERKSARLGISLPSRDLLLMLVHLGDDSEEGADLSRVNYAKHCLAMLLNERADKDHLLVETDGRHIALLLHTVPEMRQERFQLGEAIIAAWSGLTGCTPTVGIGRMCRTVEDLPCAYSEAADALKHRSVLGGGQVIYYEDVALADRPEWSYPMGKEALLCGSVRMSDLERALSIYREFLDEMKQRRPSFVQIRLAFIRLVTAVLNTVHSMGIRLDESADADSPLLRKVLELESLTEIGDGFEAALRHICALVQKQIDLKEEDHISEVLRRIESRLAEDVTLTDIADALKLNPSYVSRLFKEKVGMNYIEYLTRQRIERSKELLEQSALKIQEVSARVGYRMPHYFIKIFREHTGVTPGQYRKMFVDKQ